MTKAKATKLDKEIQEGLYDPSKQKKFEKECKAKAHGGKKLKGQQKLTSAVSTSKRLKEFVYDTKPSNYVKLEHGDILMKDGLVVQKTLPGVKTTGLKSDYKIYGKINSPSDVLKFVSDMENYDREYAKVLHLDTKNNVVGVETVSIGSLNAAVTHPREIFKKAVLDNSASIVFVHNHPSGDPTPSNEDKNMTEKLQKTGGIIGISLLDSVVIGRGRYYSFKESGAMIPDAKLFDIKGIADSLRRQGIEPDLIDIEAEYDHSLSHRENLAHIKDLLGLGGRRSSSEYEKMAEEFYRAQTMGTGRLANVSPQERAAAFARMRETGTLRGYDPKTTTPRKFAKLTHKMQREIKQLYEKGASESELARRYKLSIFGVKHAIHGKLRGYDPKPAAMTLEQVKAEIDIIRNKARKERHDLSKNKRYRVLTDYLYGKRLYDLKQVGGGFEVKIPYNKRFLIAVKSMKGSRWNPESKSWFVPSEWEGELTILMRDLGYAREKRSTRYYDPKPPSRWYVAMVKGIKKSSDVKNPYAIVKSIWTKLSPSKKAEIKTREKKGERFKYDLPLPVDKPTRGTGTVRMVKPFKLAEVQVNLSVKDYLSALKSGLFSRMKRHDGTTALVARCKSPEKNVNVFVDKAGK